MKLYKEIKQGTDEWHHIRKGKITGTTLKSIMGTPRAKQEAFYEVLAERLTIGVQSDYENAMDRGLRLEDEAISIFEFTTGKTVEKVGFCESDTNEFICNSPDGLIGDTEAIEIKCMGGKNHIKMCITNEIPDEYEWQVVQYFIVNTKLDTLYFVGYNPDIPTHTLHIITINRNDILDKITKAENAETLFLEEINNAIIKIETPASV